MELLVLDKKTWEVEISSEATQVSAFATLITRDLSTHKEMVKKEMAFLYFYVNPLSEFFYIRNLEERKQKIVKTLGLEDTWDIDPYMFKAVEVYSELCVTLHGLLYNAACSAAMSCYNYLQNTEKHLKERTEKGSAVTSITAVINGLAKIPKVMTDLSTAYKTLVVEQTYQDNRQKGSKQLNMFEDGFEVESVSNSTE